MRCTLEQQDFGAHLVHPLPQKQARSFLLCFLGPCASCVPCAELCHRQAQGRAGTTVCQTAAAARWFPGVVTVGVEVRAHRFCGEIASESLKLVHLALTAAGKDWVNLSLYSQVQNPHTNVDLTLKLVLGFMAGGGKLLPQELTV